MTILALDQSTKITGYSVFKQSELINSGILEIKKSKNFDIFQRFELMQTKIAELIEKENPDIVIVENVQYQQNFLTFQHLSNLQGVIYELLILKGIPYMIVEPSKWKSFLGIKGKVRVEQKKNTQLIIKEKFNITASEDEADAIGIGYWGVNHVNDRKEEIYGSKK